VVGLAGQMPGAALEWAQRPRRRKKAAASPAGLSGLTDRLLARLSFLREEFADHSARKPPWPTRAGLLGKGFLATRRETYGPALEKHPELYLSDLARTEHGERYNAPFTIVLQDKLIFWGMMRGLSDAVAPVAALIHGSLLTWLEGPRAGTTQPLQEGLEALEGRHVLKSPRGSRGQQIFAFEQRAGVAMVDGVDLPVARLAEIFAGSILIVCPFVQQAPYAERIFPQTANSVRLLTIFDDERRAPFLAAVCHRFGRAGAVSIADNWDRGGLLADLDLETGVLGQAVWLDAEGRRGEGPAHPDSGARITGVAVESWPRIRSGILDLAARVPFLPVIGWDVVATAGGYSILEGNGRPGLTSVQAFRPLLANPRVRRCMGRRGFI
jgi:hypothetical protein